MSNKFKETFKKNILTTKLTFMIFFNIILKKLQLKKKVIINKKNYSVIKNNSKSLNFAKRNNFKFYNEIKEFLKILR